MPIVRHSHDPALRDVLSCHRPATWIESFASMDWAVEATLDLHAAVSRGVGGGSGLPELEMPLEVAMQSAAFASPNWCSRSPATFGQ
ncbi:hypothetical protein D7U89_15210 [Stenotrophomonas maltophilia]|nr:hypothetical protein [Stenotrophomonas maltophilia]MBA0367897.1 hypothetical protein [Stenotrophomonas maltophilia]MBA0403042.1 hypothetical protein [Stenotrophomonas maltophilia]